MSAGVLGPAPAAPRAAVARVDVWRLSLAPPPGAALKVLAPDERARAARMRFGGERWAAARVALRTTLARYLDAAPCELVFASGPRGKPRLAWPDVGLRFSLSHSDDVGLLAARLGHEVGADVERIRDDVDGEAIARSLFSPRDRAAMAALADAGPRDAFFRTWVRREAFAKATGVGLALPGDREDAGYVVREVRGIPGCAAAVASEGRDWTIALR